MKEYLAKSDSKITLSEHLINVAEMSSWMSSKLTDNKDLIAASYVCGILHDSGKILNSFQEYLINGFTEHCNHNIISAALVNAIYNQINIGSVSFKNEILSVIKYHHPVDNDKNINISEIDFNNAYDFLLMLKNNIESNYNNVSIIVNMKDNIDLDDVSEDVDVAYIDNNEHKFFLRNILTPADNIVSYCEHTGKNQHDVFNELMCRNEKTNYTTFNTPEGYDSRFSKQLNYVKQMRGNGKPIDIFASETGFGKTMLGVMYLLMNNNKRGYWICPNNSIAKNSYETIIRELKNLNLPYNVSVDLLLGNEYQGNGKQDKSDIIVTNIDNFFRPVIKSDAKKLNNAYQILFGNCVFDEFHSYMSKSAIMSAFMLICKVRKNYATINTKTLLLSATPSSYFLKKLGYNEKDVIYHKNEKVLNKKIELNFCDTMPSGLTHSNTFVCLNSRKYCQEVYLDECVDNLYHAAYIDSYKSNIYTNLKATHSDKKNISNSSWAVTSIATTGLDISFQNGVFSNIFPSMFLQALGRIDRWHNLKSTPKIIVLKTNNKSEIGAVRTFTPEKVNSKIKNFNDVSKKYISYLETTFGNNAKITIGDIYKATSNFETDNKELLFDFYKEIKKESDKNLKKIQYSYNRNKKDDNFVVAISSKANLRSSDDVNGIFVLLKDYKSKEYINELFQIDASELTNLGKNFWKDALKESNLNKYQSKAVKKWNDIKIYEYLTAKAKVSDSPIKIPYGLYHDSELGLINRNN